MFGFHIRAIATSNIRERVAVCTVCRSRDLFVVVETEAISVVVVVVVVVRKGDANSPNVQLSKYDFTTTVDASTPNVQPRGLGTRDSGPHVRPVRHRYR